MCRLLGIVSKVETESRIFENFAQQCLTGCVKPSHTEPGHMDGWGLGFLKDGRMEVVKSGKDARSDELYKKTYPLISKSGVILGHIRKATDPKTKGVAQYAHPFAKEGWVFAHNGSVFWKEETKRNFPNLIDSQIVLELILSKIRGAANIFDKICEVAQEIIEKERISGLNFLLTNGKDFICYRFFDDGDPENQGYYTLYKKQEKNRIMIASEPVDQDKTSWQLIQPGELCLISPELEVQTRILNFQRVRQ